MNRDAETMMKVRELIKRYVDDNGVTSTRAIAEYVFSACGNRPSTATVAIILREMGISAHRQPLFVWRHSKGHDG